MLNAISSPNEKAITFQIATTLREFIKNLPDRGFIYQVGKAINRIELAKTWNPDVVYSLNYIYMSANYLPEPNRTHLQNTVKQSLLPLEVHLAAKQLVDFCTQRRKIAVNNIKLVEYNQEVINILQNSAIKIKILPLFSPQNKNFQYVYAARQYILKLAADIFNLQRKYQFLDNNLNAFLQQLKKVLESDKISPSVQLTSGGSQQAEATFTRLEERLNAGNFSQSNGYCFALTSLWIFNVFKELNGSSNKVGAFNEKLISLRNTDLITTPVKFAEQIRIAQLGHFNHLTRQSILEYNHVLNGHKSSLNPVYQVHEEVIAVDAKGLALYLLTIFRCWGDKAVFVPLTLTISHPYVHTFGIRYLDNNRYEYFDQNLDTQATPGYRLLSSDLNHITNLIFSFYCTSETYLAIRISVFSKYDSSKILARNLPVDYINDRNLQFFLGEKGNEAYLILLANSYKRRHLTEREIKFLNCSRSLVMQSLERNDFNKFNNAWHQAIRLFNYGLVKFLLENFTFVFNQPFTYDGLISQTSLSYIQDSRIENKDEFITLLKMHGVN